MCNLFYVTTQICSCMCRMQLNFSCKWQLQNPKFLVVVTCESRIGKKLDVVLKVSFSIAIMSLVLCFKCWKLNNGVFTSFCAISRIWNWHSIKWWVENCVFLMYMYSWDTRIWCPSSLWCNSFLPIRNKMCSSSMLRGQKDCGMIPWAPLALIIGLEPDASPSV